MRPTDTADLWWKTAVIYNLNVQTFLDWDDDGTGDFAGLGHRLDYLAGLGVTCLWLAPFYPSPRRDNGYDIADYYGVDPQFGDLGDLVDVICAAKGRGMRVVVDLVVNHTSEQHPWFRRARAGTGSPYRDYYIWTDDPGRDESENMFPSTEEGVWTLDERTGQHYRHSFFREQPDLNIANPAVRDQVGKVVGFWLALGVDGFRVDAVPHAISVDGAREHSYLRDLRRTISRRQGSAIMLGEVNLPYEEQLDFFGSDAEELTMQFDFPGNQRLYVALARQDARPLMETVAGRPEIPVSRQWANFVRNHDELTLDLLSDTEREEVFEAFAPQQRMRLDGRGILRRLPSMLEGDPRRVRMVYSLMFSLPGTPVLYYGEEIGMAENPDVSGRDAVRTPMQWDAGKNGGFSQAAPSRLPLPLVTGGMGPDHVNVAAQLRDPDSMLEFTRRLIRCYRDSPEIGWGEFHPIEQPHPCVFAHCMRSETGELIALHNFAPDGRTVQITVEDADDSTRVIDMLGANECSLGEDGSLELVLDGYGYRWLRIIRAGEKRLA